MSPLHLEARRDRRRFRAWPRWQRAEVKGGCPSSPECDCRERVDRSPGYWRAEHALEVLRALSPFSPLVRVEPGGGQGRLAGALVVEVVAPDPRALRSLLRVLGWSFEVERGWRPSLDLPHPLWRVHVEGPFATELWVYRERLPPWERPQPALPEGALRATLEEDHGALHRRFTNAGATVLPHRACWTSCAPGSQPVYDPLPGYEGDGAT